MADAELEPEEAMTADEIAGEAPAPDEGAEISRQAPINAFTMLMKPKKKHSDSAPSPRSASHAGKVWNLNREGLGVYIKDPSPAKYPPGTIIFHNADFVAIKDRYPKSFVHCLLLPRSEKHTLQHPFEAFEDAEFLKAVREQAAALKKIVAAELQRSLGPFSAKDALRERALSGELPIVDGQLPAGRDWEAEVKVGVHARPSMSHIHVHVLSRDMAGPALRHGKHYNSFNTPFLVSLDDFPLAPDHAVWQPEMMSWHKTDLICWRCGQNFKNRIQQLKDHLAAEFEEWKKE